MDTLLRRDLETDWRSAWCKRRCLFHKYLVATAQINFAILQSLWSGTYSHCGWIHEHPHWWSWQLAGAHSSVMAHSFARCNRLILLHFNLKESKYIYISKSILVIKSKHVVSWSKPFLRVSLGLHPNFPDCCHQLGYIWVTFCRTPYIFHVKSMETS